MKNFFLPIIAKTPVLFTLFLLCAIFYTFIHFSAAAAIDRAQGAQSIEMITLMRLVAGIIFSLFLGYIGVKISNHIWPAVFVHSVVISAMLAMDIPPEQLLQEWKITFFIIGLMASLTGISGGIYLAFLWFKYNKPLRKHRFLRQK